jgi:hypothetical protein
MVPVVQRSTICIVMILSALKGWKSVQCDITAAFIHALLKPGEEIYVHQPHSFKVKYNHALKLCHSLYGLRQAPHYFFEYFTEHLIHQRLTPLKYDPCLFFSSTLIVIIYINNILIYCKDDGEVDNFIKRMRSKKRLPCIKIKKVRRKVTWVLTSNERGLKLHRLRAVSPRGTSRLLDLIQNGAPAAILPLKRLLYLEMLIGHPQAVHSTMPAPLYCFCTSQGTVVLIALLPQTSVHTTCLHPLEKHEKALTQIDGYLKGTLGKGLILSPSHTLHIDCYPDFDFAGLWKYADDQDPHCV